MTKKEFNKYLKNAFARIKMQNKSLTPKNLEIELTNEIIKDNDVYIAYAKVALHNLINSANIITLPDIIKEIDAVKNLYYINDLLIKANNL